MSGWRREPFDAVLADESAGNFKTPQSEFLPSGRYPIVDQGKDLIAGYTDDASRLCRATLPVVVFGDHTRCFKYVDFPFCMGADGVKVLRPRIEADAKYLYHYLRQLRLIEGGYDRHFKYLKRSSIPLPPLAEQRRIAEILDKADALRAKRRAALAKLDTFTQSIFLDMFGDPATNPKGWPWYRLGDVTAFFAGSTLPAGEQFTGQRDGYFLLKVSDMNLPGNSNYFETCQLWSSMPGAASCTCPAGSVVIPKRGGAIGTNKKRITTRPSVLDPNLMAIVPRPGQVELQFLYGWLLRLDLAFIASGSSVPQLNKRDLDPLSIAVPPVDLQGQYAHRLEAVEGIAAVQRAAVANLDGLHGSLRHRAFRGEL